MTPYPIFLSSPSGLEEERKVIDQVIKTVADVVLSPLQLLVMPKLWERQPPTMAPVGSSIQTKLNEVIHQCRAFILLLGDRQGSKEKGQSLTNTQREFEEAVAKQKRQQGFQIFAYFKKFPANKDAGPQRRGVEQFKKKVLKSGVLAVEYGSLDRLRLRLTEDLFKVLLNFRNSTFKVSMLKRFWKIGVPSTKHRYNTLIIYPPASPPCASNGGVAGINCGIGPPPTP